MISDLVARRESAHLPRIAHQAKASKVTVGGDNTVLLHPDDNHV
jgi:hypothetical protein